MRYVCVCVERERERERARESEKERERERERDVLYMHTYNIHTCIQYDSAKWKPAFLRQAREFLFFPLLPREASK